jgi:hypothetical protein
MIPDGPRLPMNGGLRNAIAQEARNGASTRSYSRTGRMVRLRYAVAYDLGADTISAVRLYLPLDALVRQLRES